MFGGFNEYPQIVGHNLCFGQKIRKPNTLHTPVSYIKVGLNGLYIEQTCFPDGVIELPVLCLTCKREVLSLVY